MAIGFTIKELSVAAVRADCARQKIRKIVEIECGNLIFAILNIQLRVVENAAEFNRMLAVHPVVSRRDLVLVLEDPGISEVRGWTDLQLVARSKSDLLSPSGVGSRVCIVDDNTWEKS